MNPIYGVTRNPLTHEYAIITKFQNAGNFRRMISENQTEFTWAKITDIFTDISRGLLSIHQNDYYHKDFHSGNILNTISIDPTKNLYKFYPVISDFGMSRPANESLTDKTVYGVLPFVAPEILLGKKYTKEADIYGFGMIMWEIISGEPPFIDREYDQYLIIDICINQLPPPIPEYAPEPYVTLMKQCWDTIPTNRPTADHLWNQFSHWHNCLIFANRYQKKSQQIKRAFNNEREKKWKKRLAERAKNPRPLKQSHNLLISKKLDYSKYLSELLKNGMRFDYMSF